jgi:hypothetical protein
MTILSIAALERTRDAYDILVVDDFSIDGTPEYLIKKVRWMYVCMHGFMYGWMDACTDGWMHARMDGCMHARMYGCMDICT